MRFLDQLQSDLVLASREISDAKRQLVPARRRLKLLVAIALGVLALAAAAYAASRIIAVGTPLRAPLGLAPKHPRRDVGLGVPLAGSRAPAGSHSLGGSRTSAGLHATAGSQLLGIAIADPAGGPPWGVRVVRTTRGLRCVQFGRLQGNVLGVLGQDREFGDDGLLHPLPAALLDPGQDTCVPPGSSLVAYIAAEPASAAPPLPASQTCTAPGPSYGHAGGLPPPCPQGDERQVAFGLLGPHAVSVTYHAAGATGTTPVSGALGAYLIVVPQPAAVGPDHFALATSIAPQDAPNLESAGPVISVTYRHAGRLCRIDAPGLGSATPSPSSPPSSTPRCPGSAQVARVRPEHASPPRGPGSGGTAGAGAQAGAPGGVTPTGQPILAGPGQLRGLSKRMQAAARAHERASGKSIGTQPAARGRARGSGGDEAPRTTRVAVTVKHVSLGPAAEAGFVGYELAISFRAPYAVRDAHTAYALQLTLPSGPGCPEGNQGKAIERNVARGAKVTTTFTFGVSSECRGTAHGSVLYGAQPDAFSGPGNGRAVGRFTFLLH